MKLLIASDIHGSAYYCGTLMQVIQREQPDRLLLLGDLLYHGPRNDLPREYAPKAVIPMLSAHKDIIIAVGYENTSFFHNQFRERYHCSPFRWRKNRREEN